MAGRGRGEWGLAKKIVLRHPNLFGPFLDIKLHFCLELNKVVLCSRFVKKILQRKLIDNPL